VPNFRSKNVPICPSKSWIRDFVFIVSMNKIVTTEK